jgi:hypothetical protein
MKNIFKFTGISLSASGLQAYPCKKEMTHFFEYSLTAIIPYPPNHPITQSPYSLNPVIPKFPPKHPFPMDFTLTSLTTLLKSLQKASYQFQTLTSHLKTSNPEPRTPNAEPQTPNPKSLNPVIPKSLILLRHDVDLLPQNSLATAKLEHSLGIRGTYYFRIVPQSLNPEIIREIASLGHEIGYHYEDLDLAHKKLKKI